MGLNFEHLSIIISPLNKFFPLFIYLVIQKGIEEVFLGKILRNDKSTKFE